MPHFWRDCRGYCYYQGLKRYKDGDVYHISTQLAYLACTENVDLQK